MDTAGHTRTRRVVSALTVVALGLLAPVATAQPVEPSPIDQLDDATQEAVSLEEEIQALEDEGRALETRLAVLDERIAAQRERLEQARDELKRTRATYGARVVDMYKNGATSPILMMLQAESVEDLLARSSLLVHIATRDRVLWEKAAVGAAEEHFQANALEDLRAQDDELRHINESRRLTLEQTLGRQDALIEQLSAEAEAYLQEVRASQAQSRQDWIDSSLPMDSEFVFVDATVDPHQDRTYLVPDHQPLRYRSTGETAVMVCSWYGPGFHGRTTASGQVFNENDFTCASKTLAFGTRLALTRGNRRIIVVVNDRGPFIAGRDLDLSKAAAAALGFSGVEPVHVEFVLTADD